MLLAGFILKANICKICCKSNVSCYYLGPLLLVPGPLLVEPAPLTVADPQHTPTALTPVLPDGRVSPNSAIQAPCLPVK